MPLHEYVLCQSLREIEPHQNNRQKQFTISISGQCDRKQSLNASTETNSIVCTLRLGNRFSADANPLRIMTEFSAIAIRMVSLLFMVAYPPLQFQNSRNKQEVFYLRM